MDPANLDAPPPIAPNPPRHIVAVAGLVRDAVGRVLLVRSERRGWEHPGGHVEPGEDLISALLREIEEETGCRVRVTRLLGFYSLCNRPYYQMLIFACTYLNGAVRASHEHLDVAWFADDAAQATITPVPTHAPQDDLFNPGAGPMYRAYRDENEIRTHDGSLSDPPLDLVLPERWTDSKPRQIVATSGCVRDYAGRILLVRSGWRGWEFPGGQVEQGEDLISGVQREIQEESGCTVAVGALLGVYCNVGEPYVLQFMFACHYLGGELTPSFETPEVAWFTPDDALALPLRSAFRARLEDALSNESGVAYRVYRTRPAYDAISARRI